MFLLSSIHFFPKCISDKISKYHWKYLNNLTTRGNQCLNCWIVVIILWASSQLPGHGPYQLSCLQCTSYRCYLRSQYLCNIYPHQAQVSTPSWFWKCWLLITKAWQRFQTEWAKIILSLYYFNKVYSYNIVKTQSTINHTQGWRCDISKLLQSIISLQKKNRYCLTI